MPTETNCSIGVFLSTPTVEHYVAEYRKISNDVVHTTPASFKEALIQAREWEQQGVEVFISRRGTGDFLRRNLPTPVLSLPLSEMEIIRCLRDNCDKGIRVFIPMYKEPYPGLEELIGIPIIQQVYADLGELDSLIHNIARARVDVVAGGGTTQRLAQKYKIPYIDLSPSREQFFTILDSARNVAASNREKKAMVQEMQCMMNSMADGFISVDPAGQIINANDAALTLLKSKKSEDLVGASILSYFGEDTFQSMLQSNRAHYEKILDIRGTSLVVNVSFIKSHHSVERMLITLRKAQDVIRQSGTIRSAISRGFEANYRLRDVVCKSRAMRGILDLCRAYSKTNSSVLICGETGTGKEMLAQGIHNKSKRSIKPFVSVNCAELPEHLLESELFGYDEGAFTGSRKGGKAGFFELAHTGTILLDEVDSASIPVQSKLLRVLQEKEIMRIGGRRKIPVDVRVLATSGRDLWEQVQLGNFRKDLFFRLNVMTVHIPPLRERAEDVELLVQYFLDYFVRFEEVRLQTITREQMQLLKQYSWPGNVRQLRHFAERFVLYCSFMDDPFYPLYNEFKAITFSNRPDPVSSPFSAVPAEQVSHPGLPGTVPPPLPGGARGVRINSNNNQALPLLNDILNGSKAPLDDPDTLLMVLEHARYSRKEAARILGVSRSTLWRKLKRYNLD